MKIVHNGIMPKDELKRDFPQIWTIFSKTQMRIFVVLYENLRHRVSRVTIAKHTDLVKEQIFIIRQKLRENHLPFAIFTNHENYKQILSYELWKFL